MPVVDGGAGWCGSAAGVRDGGRAVQTAGAAQGALACLLREKVLDKLCKCILDWK